MDRKGLEGGYEDLWLENTLEDAEELRREFERLGV